MSWWYLPARSLLPRAGAGVFCVFFLVAFTLRRLGISDDVTVRVAGGLAWAFLAFTVVVLLTARSRARQQALRAAAAFLQGDGSLIARVGSPVTVDVAPDQAPPVPGEWRLAGSASGPLGELPVTVTMARDAGTWRATRWES